MTAQRALVFYVGKTLDEICLMSLSYTDIAVAQIAELTLGSHITNPLEVLDGGVGSSTANGFRSQAFPVINIQMLWSRVALILQLR